MAYDFGGKARSRLDEWAEVEVRHLLAGARVDLGEVLAEEREDVGLGIALEVTGRLLGGAAGTVCKVRGGRHVDEDRVFKGKCMKWLANLWVSQR